MKFASVIGIALFLGGAVEHQAAAAASTGSMVLDECSLAVQQSDGKKLDQLEMLKALSCTSYVSGFLDATGMVHSLRPKTQLVCLPEGGITNDQGVRLIVKYLRDKPETLHESGRMAVMIALAKAFSCLKK